MGTDLISKLRHYAPKSVLTNLYYSFLQSYLNYSILNWTCVASTKLNNIRTALKKAVRLITYSNKYEHTPPLFKTLNILPFDQLLKLRQATLMWKTINGYVPSPINELFKVRENTLKFHTPSPSNYFEKLAINFSCPKVWNTNVPETFRKLQHLNSFTKKYKAHLLQAL